MHWLLHFLGLDSASGPAYLAYSGAGSDVTELAIVGTLISVYRRNACHEPHCWRIGHHPVEGTPFRACRKHHPALGSEKPQRGHMTAAWHAARRAQHHDPGCAAERVRAQNSAAEITDTQAREGKP